MKNIPQRTCVGCNSSKNKNELLRIVKNNKDEISIDIKGIKEGRGIYICKSQDCLEKAIKNKKISKTFKVEIPNEVYSEILNYINGGDIIG